MYRFYSCIINDHCLQISNFHLFSFLFPDIVPLSFVFGFSPFWPERRSAFLFPTIDIAYPCLLPHDFYCFSFFNLKSDFVYKNPDYSISSPNMFVNADLLLLLPVKHQPFLMHTKSFVRIISISCLFCAIQRLLLTKCASDPEIFRAAILCSILCKKFVWCMEQTSAIIKNCFRQSGISCGW